MTDRESRLNDLRNTPRCGDSINDRSDGLDRVDGLIDLMEYTKPGCVLEIGTNRGVSTEVFLLFSDHVTVVDPWLGSGRECYGGDPQFDENDETFRRFMDRCGAYPNLTVIRGYSPRDVAKLPPESFDLVYIDGIHGYDAVVTDIQAARPLVRPGGWIAGHDYMPGFEANEVVPAVDKTLGKPEKMFSDFSWAFRV